MSLGRPARPVRTATGVTDQRDSIITETQLLSGKLPVATPVAPYCHIEDAIFDSIPSGAVPATLTGTKLGADFDMIAGVGPVIPCNCSCGEYRQYVRGTFTVNGKNHAHSLGGGRNLDPTTYQEDGNVAAGTVYGHRRVRGTKSVFKPDQAGGCQFQGSDQPGISAGSGTKLEMDLEFVGNLIDTCAGSAVLETSSWSVVGSATVP
ncbi:MAG: hypothetical protein ACOY71_02585 [Gemmatimonadota bacterium]